MTSNIASDKIMQLGDVPELDGVIMDELKQRFKPEFLNRLDDIVRFNPLDLKEIVKIIDIFFEEIQEKVKERSITLALSESAKALIAEAGFDPVYGARPLKRALYESVEDELAELILSEKVDVGSNVLFDVNEGKIEVSVS